MPRIFTGAINKQTGKYESPIMAQKPNKFLCPHSNKKISKFSCPSCRKDVCLKAGVIILPHFAHYASVNPCKYYNNPGESEKHKDAKLALKAALERGKSINLFRKCNSCKSKNTDTIQINNENTTVCMEYPFMLNNSRKFADIACVEGDSIKYIFEICQTNKTYENDRPEPWFEINAEEAIEKINTSLDNTVELNCIRDYKCNICVSRENEEKGNKDEQRDSAKSILSSMLARAGKTCNTSDMRAVVLDYPVIKDWCGGCSSGLCMQIPSYFYTPTTGGAYKCASYDTLKAADIDVRPYQNEKIDDNHSVSTSFWDELGNKHLQTPLFTADVFAYGGKHNSCIEVWMIDDKIIDYYIATELLKLHSRMYENVSLFCIPSEFILLQDKNIEPSKFMELCRNKAVNKTNPMNIRNFFGKPTCIRTVN